MVSFGQFLIGMGYPEAAIRHPGDGRWSHSPYEDSAQLAGLVAWYYEHDGMRPMLIGHSQGGIQAVKVLRELAGEFTDAAAGLESAHRRRRGASHDRRSADRRASARSSGVTVVLRLRGRRRRRSRCSCPTSGA